MTEAVCEVQEQEAGSLAQEAAGQYLTFRLGGEMYALPILKVQEIIGIMPVTAVPKAPDFVRGVINLRGKVIPVVDLRLKFCMESQEDTERTCIIVVQLSCQGRPVTMGVIIDEVSEVLSVGASQIEPAPGFGASVDADFILAMAKIDERVVMLLDIQKALTGAEFTVPQP